MECRTLEITVGSAKDLKDVNLFSKMDVYAVVSIQGDPFGATQKQKTNVHKDSGPNPSWNFPMTFTLHEDSLQQNRLILKIELKSERSLGDKEIGEVHVHIKELLDSHAEKKSDISYSVRTPSGKSKGTLNLLYKLGDKYNVPAQEKPKMAQEPVMAYPTGYAPGASSAYPHPPPPQPHYGAYPQQPPYGAYPAPPPPGYAYAGYPPQPGYGYGGYPPQKPKKNNGAGKMALGLGAGLLGGLLVGDMISDAGEMAAYDAGFDDGMDF